MTRLSLPKAGSRHPACAAWVWPPDPPQQVLAHRSAPAAAVHLTRFGFWQVGIDIFFREAQTVWPELVPFVDGR